jgi:hypothetical protein
MQEDYIQFWQVDEHDSEEVDDEDKQACHELFGRANDIETNWNVANPH